MMSASSGLSILIPIGTALNIVIYSVSPRRKRCTAAFHAGSCQIVCISNVFSTCSSVRIPFPRYVSMLMCLFVMYWKNLGANMWSCEVDCDCDSIVLDAKHLISKYPCCSNRRVMSSKRCSIPEFHSKKRIFGRGDMRHVSSLDNSVSIIGSCCSVCSSIFWRCSSCCLNTCLSATKKCLVPSLLASAMSHCCMSH